MLSVLTLKTWGTALYTITQSLLPGAVSSARPDGMVIDALVGSQVDKQEGTPLGVSDSTTDSSPLTLFSYFFFLVIILTTIESGQF